jgi:hypothetical protein
MARLLVETFIAGCACCDGVADTVRQALAPFGDSVEHRVLNAIYQPEVVRKYGVITPPTVIVGGRFKLTNISAAAVAEAVAKTLAA